MISSALAWAPYSQQNKATQDSVSILSLCAVAYGRFSEKMTNNPELRESSLQTARNLYQMTVNVIGEKDASDLLDISSASLTNASKNESTPNKALADVMAGCLKILKNLK